LLAKNFGVPEATFDGFPKKEVYFARGEQPPRKPANPLAGQKSPPQTHKYRLLANPPRVNNKGGRLWVVDSTKFPISKTITGAILELDPGALRELHWHPSADEWQYVLQGKVSVTLFGSGGRARIETLEQGDVGYIPQGYGHSLENVGDGKCRVLIGFNAGIYEDIDLSEWMAGNPADVLATNFGKPAALFEKFPHKDIFITDKNGR
jgi:oxalate decarboxylase